MSVNTLAMPDDADGDAACENLSTPDFLVAPHERDNGDVVWAVFHRGDLLRMKTVFSTQLGATAAAEGMQACFDANPDHWASIADNFTREAVR